MDALNQHVITTGLATVWISNADRWVVAAFGLGPPFAATPKNRHQPPAGSTLQKLLNTTMEGPTPC